jgi:hypothetical protein
MASFDSATIAHRQFVSPLTVTLIAAFLELIGEPFYALLQARLLIRRRVRVNGLATLTRCLAVYLFAIQMEMGLMAFALGEIVKSFTDTCGFAYVAYENGLLQDVMGNTSILGCVRRVVRMLAVDIRVLRRGLRIGVDELRRQRVLLGVFYWQTSQKLVLTEAEKIALWFGASLFSQVWESKGRGWC